MRHLGKAKTCSKEYIIMDKELKQTTWKRLWEKVDERGISSLEEHERIWVTVDGLISDVTGGGMISFSYNHGDDDYDETIEALEKINATDAIKILNQMSQLFPNGKPPRNIDERNEIIDSWNHDELNDYFEDLDDQFYAIQADIEKKLEIIIEKAVRQNL